MGWWRNGAKRKPGLVEIPTTAGRGFAVRGLVPGFFGLLLRVIVDGLALVVGVHAEKRADKNQESFESHNVMRLR